MQLVTPGGFRHAPKLNLIHVSEPFKLITSAALRRFTDMTPELFPLQQQKKLSQAKQLSLALIVTERTPCRSLI
jgi:hypothetical protein